MATGRQIQKKGPSNATPTPTTGMFKPRPFAMPAEPEAATAPELQTKAEPGQVGGSRLSRIDFSAPPPIQPKLAIGAPGDKYEQEADTIARKVVKQISPPTPPDPNSTGSDGTVQRQMFSTPSIMRLTVQRREAVEGGTASSDLESTISQARSGGRPLGKPIRNQMEGAFGADLSSVRVHDDTTSDSLNQSLGSSAFTTGKDVFFQTGKYNPDSQTGQELIAHELTHVVQQGSTPIMQRKLTPVQLKGANGSPKPRDQRLPDEEETEDLNHQEVETQPDPATEASPAPASEKTETETETETETKKSPGPKKSKPHKFNVPLIKGVNWSGTVDDKTFEGTLDGALTLKAQGVEYQEYNPLNFDEQAGTLSQTDEFTMKAASCKLTMPGVGQGGIELTLVNFEANRQGIDWTTASLSTLEAVNLGKGVKISNPVALVKGMEAKYSSEISGDLEIDLGNQATGLKSSGHVKVLYDREKRQWNTQVTGGAIEAGMADLFTVKADNLEYEQKAHRLIAPSAVLSFNGTQTTATVNGIKIYRGGIDWDDAVINNSGEFSVGGMASISSPTGKVKSNKGTYLAEVSGNFKMNLEGSKSSGKLTLRYDSNDRHWDGQLAGGSIDGAIAGWEFKATEVEFNNYSYLELNDEGFYQKDKNYLKAKTASLSLPKLKQAKIQAKAEGLEIESDRLDWDNATLKADKELNFGDVLKINNPQALLQGAKTNYTTQISGDLDLNLGASSEIASLQTSGSIKIDYDGQTQEWKGDVEEASLSATLVERIKLNAQGLQYDHKAGSLTSESAILKIDDSQADAKNLKINRQGIDWEETTLKAPKELDFGSIVQITNANAKIKGQKAGYSTEITGGFGLKASGELGNFKTGGNIKITYDGDSKNWAGAVTNGTLEGKISEDIAISASNLDYDHYSGLEFGDDSLLFKDHNDLKAESAKLTLPSLNNTSATAKGISLNRDGFEWQEAILNTSDINIGDFLKIEKATANIKGKSDNYSSQIAGDFGLELGSASEIGSLQTSGSLQINYDGSSKEWQGTVQEGAIAAKVVDYVDLDATAIHYDHKARTVTSDSATLKIEEASAEVKTLKINRKGIDWEETTLSVNKQLDFGEIASITDATAKIKGKSAGYSTEITGGFGLKDSGELGNFQAGGSIRIAYDGDTKNWEGAVTNGTLAGIISNYIEVNAEQVDYDHYSSLEFGEDSLLFADNNILKAKTAKLTLSSLNNTSATATDVNIDREGIDWKEIALSTQDIKFGDFASITSAKANIAGKSKNYSAEIAGNLGVDIGSADITQVQAGGSLKITYNGESEEWDGTFNNATLKATIANVINLDASGIEYDRYEYLEFTDDGIFMPENYLNLSETTLSIPKLNNTTGNAKDARIYSDGIDWATVKVSTNDIALGKFMSIKGAEATIDGKASNYTTRVGGGVEMSFGEYFKADGQGTLLFDRSSGENTDIQVEKAKLSARGNLDLPGENGLIPGWPIKFEFNYPIVPGVVEAGAGLNIYGGVGINIGGEIAKDNPGANYSFKVNPEAKGTIGVELYAGAAIGSSYILSLGAYLNGSAEAQTLGGLKFSGGLDYNLETEELDTSNLTSLYYAKADFIAKVGGKVKATAFYFFEKELYRITFADWNLGTGSLDGKITIDDQGQLKFEPADKEGVLLGKINKDSQGGPQYEVISLGEARALLKKANERIENGGEERQTVMAEVQGAYEKSLQDVITLMQKEQKESQKYEQTLFGAKGLDEKVMEYASFLKQMSGRGEKEYTKEKKKFFGLYTSKTKYSKKQLNQIIDDLMDKETKAVGSFNHHLRLLVSLEDQQQEAKEVLQDVQKAIANVKQLEEGIGVENIDKMQDSKAQLEKDKQELKQKAEQLEEQIQEATAADQKIEKILT